jgi:hypothetical protein
MLKKLYLGLFIFLFINIVSSQPSDDDRKMALQPWQDTVDLSKKDYTVNSAFLVFGIKSSVSGTVSVIKVKDSSQIITIKKDTLYQIHVKVIKKIGTSTGLYSKKIIILGLFKK